MRSYAMITASILLAMGIIGFAFNEQFDIPPFISLVHLIMGLWGMWIIFSPKNKK